MSTLSGELTERERELGAIIGAYNDVTDQLKASHEQLTRQVSGLREELARKNDQLRRRDRLAALGEMAAGLAHEIRNPLGGIRVFASLLEKDLKDQPDALRLIRKISQGTGRLETLVTHILAFGRPADPHPIPVVLDRLVAETLELASAKIARAGCRVEVSGELAGVELVTDGAMLQRALLNLLLNAIESMTPGGGRVTVGLGQDLADRVSITVCDEGPGVDPEQMDRIFNPFFTTKESGTGLGLAIVHQIIETLGGSVQVVNRRAGGAMFSLRLPCRLEETHRPARQGLSRRSA